MKTCNYCKEELSFDKFSINKATKDGFANRCRSCMSKIRNAKRVPVPRIKYDTNRTEKECKGCKQTLSIELFGKSKLLADGRENVCRDCRLARRKANAISKKFANKTEKHCSYCKGTLAISNFHKDASRDDGFGAVCKSCKREEHRAKYQNDSEYREKRNASRKKWRQENIELVRERNKKYAAKRNLSLEGKLAKYKYNAKKRNLSWELTDEEFELYWQKPCTYCGDEIAAIGIDRIDSSKGYTIKNTTSCCEVCNRVKMAHDKDFMKNHLAKMLKNAENWVE